MTVMGGGELFPSNTACVTAAYIEKKADMLDLLKNWLFAFIGNYVGCFLVAWLAFNGGTLGDGTCTVLTSATICFLLIPSDRISPQL